ncbi:MAG: AI-2E family transporter [Sulfurovaceae bacterium]|nr:AI-2E family transporter [Sulfurovaceae bacterium]MDD5548281.1 AI-2E family transporter [Sulfurovaceae bacterium]
MNNNNNYMVLFFIGLATLGAYTIYKPFLLPVVIAILLYMATYNISNKLSKYLKKRWMSATIITIFLLFAIFAPMVYLVTIGMKYISTLDQSIILQILENIKATAKDLPYIGSSIENNLNTDKILSYLQESSGYITNFTQVGLGFIKNTLFVLVFYYFINYYGDKIFSIISSFLPLSTTNSSKMIQDISATMEVVFYSTIATSVFEGILFGIIATFFGFDGILFGVIYGFASLIPIVGGAIVWLPLSLYLWSNGDSHGALMLAILSIVIISVIADTFIKPIIIKIIKRDFLKSSVEINEMVIFFAILAGMSSFGFWGIILGPAMTSFFIAMMKIYLEQNAKLD